MQDHNIFINRCLDLACRGKGRVAPNPMVGAVLVSQGQIIGEGWHKEYGAPHAEVNCIASVDPEDQHYISSSTLYVSLEPCNHFGKTPPCTELILKNKIPHVVIGAVDPHPLVNCKGVEHLRQNGVKVEVMEGYQPALQLLAPFIANSIQKRPYVILKWAQTKNGYMGHLDKRIKITGPEADLLVHHWRSQVDAIAVGTNTVITDDPLLTTRLVSGNNPTRVVLDLNNRIPEDAKIKNTASRTLIFTRERKEVNGTTEYVPLGQGEVEEDLLHFLFEKGIHSILIEGGRKLLSSYIKKGLWDEARIFTSPSLLDEGVRAPTVTGDLYERSYIGRDKLEIITPRG